MFIKGLQLSALAKIGHIVNSYLGSLYTTVSCLLLVLLGIYAKLWHVKEIKYLGGP